MHTQVRHHEDHQPNLDYIYVNILNFYTKKKNILN